jgi:hypothetical protein
VAEANTPSVPVKVHATVTPAVTNSHVGSSPIVVRMTVTDIVVTTYVAHGGLQRLDISFQVMKVLFKIIHQLENVVSVTVCVSAERLIGLSQSSLQVVKQFVHAVKVISHMVNITVLMRYGMQMSRTSIQLQSVRSQMLVSGFVTVVSREITEQFARQRLQLDRHLVDVLVRVRVGRCRERQCGQSE